MTIDTLSKFKNKIWWLTVIYAIVMGTIVYVVGLFIPFADKLIWPSLFAMSACFSIPLLIKVSSPPKRKTTKEYEKIDQDFEKVGDQLILHFFGSKEYEMLYVDEGNWLPTNSIDICRNLIGREQSKQTPELLFYLYVKLANYYSKDRQIKAAINTLRESLSIKPTSLIANFKIAVLFESIGDVAEAIKHYQMATKDIRASNNIKVFLENQIQHIKTKGARVDGPYDGSGRQWLT